MDIRARAGADAHESLKSGLVEYLLWVESRWGGWLPLPRDYSGIKIKLELDNIFAAPNFPPRWNI